MELSELTEKVKPYLGEGLHTAFRKASDSDEANEIHRLIRDMDPGEWDAILEFVTRPVLEYVLELQEKESK